ncbi:MAG: fluoride efflux transporter CrcB [Solirubrobacteraceae bacterium]
MTLLTWILVGLLGGVGALVRFTIDGLIGERAGSGPFPWGTFVVNVSGAALLGGLAGAAVTGNASVLGGTAALGSYTTLSTWMLESHRLAQDDQLVIAGANLAGSLLVGFAAVAAGHALGSAL